MNEEKDKRPPRLVEANRAQTRLMPKDLEAELPHDHQARAIWSYVERLDMSEYLAAIKSREGGLGRPATDPQILLSLWILAMVEGVGSARALDRLCRYHLAYQWLCGGVGVNHHTLSDFRNTSADLLKGLLTQSVTLLLNAGVVELRRIAHDGMKVRANAGGSSFRTRKRLEEHERIAREQVEALSREMEDDSETTNKREQTTRKRAAEDRERRISKAIDEMQEAEARKRSRNSKKKTEARTSTTDPESRIMKMGDGGFRPAFNVHLASAEKGVIVSVEVNNHGTDQNTMVPLADQMKENHGTCGEEWLADGGCVSVENIEQMCARGSKVFAPLRARTNKSRKPTDPRDTDSKAIREWRQRMGTDEGKAIYRRRGRTAEWVNARFRQMGLGQFLVRGVEKATAVVLMHALANNFQRHVALS